jgi:diadenosine tetraphosphate (Ap4A) HIT family hydrolase
MADMRLDNAREPEQLRRMQELAEKGDCHFCREGFEEKHTKPIIEEQKHWLVTANDYPYVKNDPSFHHYLIVPKRHITRISELLQEEQIELFQMIAWLENHLHIFDESIFVRTGNMDYTGATLDHLHFHFITGVQKSENSKPVRVKLAYKPNPNK